MTTLQIWNAVDIGDRDRGLVRPEAVRHASLEALVDTGAMTLVIPQDVADRLGLSRIGYRPARLADGTRRRLPVVGSLRISIVGREMTTDAIVVPAGSRPLIGQIQLEMLDLIVDPVTREVRGRLPEGPEIDLLALAA